VPTPDRTYFTFLSSIFEKETFLFKTAEFLCDISMYICIMAQIGSLPLFFSFLP
jgi:hypothetical protein